MSLTFRPRSRAFFAVSRARVIRSKASARDTFGRDSLCSSSKISSRKDSAARLEGVGVAIGGFGARGSIVGGGGGGLASNSRGQATSLPPPPGGGGQGFFGFARAFFLPARPFRSE